MATPRAVLFDYVHTLVDSGDINAFQFRFFAALRRRLVEAFRSRRREIPFIVWHVLYYVNRRYGDSYRRRETAELNLRDLFSEGLRRQDLLVDEALLDEIVALNHQVYAESLTVSEPTPRALYALKDAGLRLAVVSNNMFQPRWMENFPLLSIEGLFDAVVLSSDIGVRKPDERIYREALARLDVAPASAVFVGDRVAEDVRAPKAAGVARAFLTYEFRREVDELGEADGILRSLDDLPRRVFG